MKKNIALCILFVCIFFAGKAQQKNIEYGFQAGVNINSAAGKGAFKNIGATTGLHAGGHFKIQMTKHFGLKALLAYDQNGWVYGALVFENSNSTGFDYGDVINKLNYINLPLVAEYSCGKKIRFYLDGGVFTGYLFSTKEIKKISSPVAYTQDVTGTQRSSANFGISAGTGVQVPLAHNIKLDFGVRDNLGLVNTDNSAIKTNAFSIVTGLTFTLR